MSGKNDANERKLVKAYWGFLHRFLATLHHLKSSLGWKLLTCKMVVTLLKHVDIDRQLLSGYLLNALRKPPTPIRLIRVVLAELYILLSK